MRYLIAIVLVLLSFNSYSAEDNKKQDDDNIVDMVHEAEEAIKPENNPYQPLIEQIYDDYVNKQQLLSKDIALPTHLDIFNETQDKVLDLANLPSSDKILQQAQETCADPERLGDYRLFIFISKSVPQDTLKHYMRDALKLTNAVLVLRGTIGSPTYIMPTQDFLAELSCGKKLSELKSSTECNISRVDINPLLFRIFNIKKAPAIVFSKLSYTDLMVRNSLGQSIDDSEYYVIQGDIALQYALEQFSKHGAEVANYIKVLKGEYR